MSTTIVGVVSEIFIILVWESGNSATLYEEGRGELSDDGVPSITTESSMYTELYFMIQTYTIVYYIMIYYTVLYNTRHSKSNFFCAGKNLVLKFCARKSEKITPKMT